MIKIQIFFKYVVLLMLLLKSINTNALEESKNQLLTSSISFIRSNQDEVKIYIHFNNKQRYLANRALNIAKTIFPKIHQYFDYVPRSNVHFVLEEKSLDSNGSAQVFPYNIIKLQDYPPTGDSSLLASHDWFQTLLVHEYIHIVTLEMTHGFLDSLRTVFGSTMKFAAVNPRWFLEGIATWGETYFTNEGRIHHPLITNSVVSLLKNPDFCDDLSCWDNPPMFPHGSMAYWVGAHFLNYVENSKKGTLKCWANENSSSIPFFVNWRFEHCYGKSIYDAYFNFKNEFLKNYDKQQGCEFKNQNACQALEKYESSKNPFKGVLENEKWAVVLLNTNKKGSSLSWGAEQLFVYDKIKKSHSKFLLPMSVEQIYELNNNQFMISFWTGGVEEGLRTFAKYSLSDKRITYVSEDICKNKDDKEFSALSNIFPLTESEFLCLRYKFHTWEIGLYSNSQWKTVHRFLQGAQVYHPTVISESKKTTFKYYEFPKLPNEYPIFDGAFKQGQAKEIVIASNKISENEVTSQGVPGENDYSPISTLFPNYLLLEYFSSGTVDSYGISTSLMDPFSRHVLDLVLLYNDGLDNARTPYSGSASYKYDPGKWNFTTNYSKYRFQFPQDSYATLHVEESSSIMISREWSSTYWNFLIGPKIQRLDESDYYASRKLLQSSLQFYATHLDQRPSSYYKSLQYSVEAGVTENKSQDTYLWTLMYLKNLWQWTQDFRSQMYIQYGKQWVEAGSGLRDGSFYAGGIPTLFSYTYPFPSYLIEYGSMQGTEMLTGQFRQDWTFAYPFSGNGLVPFYLKSVGAIAGLEYLQSDKLYYDLITELDPKLWVGFFGAKFDTTLLFLLPLDIEIIYAESLDSRRTRSNLSLMLQSNIPF